MVCSKSGYYPGRKADLIRELSEFLLSLLTGVNAVVGSAESVRWTTTELLRQQGADDIAAQPTALCSMLSASVPLLRWVARREVS